MKRSVCLFLIVVLVVTISACGPKTNQENNSKVTDGVEEITAESYDFPDFYLKDPGEYFKGVLMKNDMISRANIEKGLPDLGTIKKDITVGFVTNSMENAYFILVEKTCREIIESYGYTFKTVVYNFEVSKMVAAIEDYITMGVDCILLDPSDMASATVAVEKAAEAGIPTIAIGQPVPSDSAIVTSIYPAFFDIAYEIAYKMTKEKFSDLDQEMIICNIMAASTWHTWGVAYMAGAYSARMEMAGSPVEKLDSVLTCYDYYNTFFSKGKVEIPEANMRFPAYYTDAGWTQTGGMAGAEAMISAAPDLNCIFSVPNDFMAAGAIQALENNGYKPGEDVIIIASNDGSTQGIELIRDGKLYATDNVAPELMARSACELIHAIFEEGYDANDLCAQTLLEPDIITKENWEMYYDSTKDFAVTPADKKVTFKTTQQVFKEFLEKRSN
ncbi:MAG: sugar ABC transporter substrate-binding protein [Clostridiaceae bacterium]|jgi:ribose transport system substrate-binding protein|nr:sugar ABC transporter substrate-binding protein [Clostridiaceae bacterium]